MKVICYKTPNRKSHVQLVHSGTNLGIRGDLYVQAHTSFDLVDVFEHELHKTRYDLESSKENC